MAKTRHRLIPKTFFLNEQHELTREEKPGGGRLPQYQGINWATKGKRIHDTLATAKARLAATQDPLRGERFYMLTIPVGQLVKTSENKKIAPLGTYEESTDYGKTHARVLGRLGLDLIDVTDDGKAIVHAKPERVEQLMTRSESLADLGPKEQSRWATLDAFDVVPPELRVDVPWLQSVKAIRLADVVIELQPLLTRAEVERVFRALSDMLAQKPDEQFTGNGVDFSGRHWLRGKASFQSLRTIAKEFFSVQSIHPPQYSMAASPVARSTATKRYEVGTRMPEDVEALPCIAVLDTGVPANHKILQGYKRGQFLAPGGAGRPLGNHGSFVASRVVFGEQDFFGGIKPVVGSCRYLDGQISIDDKRIDDKSVLDAMAGIVGAYPDVRVFNLSFADNLPLDSYAPVERRERLLLLQDLDNFIFANDVIVVVAAGNTAPGVVPATPYPDHVDDPQWRLGRWASGFNTLVCGASVGRLNPNGLVKNIGWPSPFTRIGPGCCGAPVPGFSAPGGNLKSDHGFEPGLGEWVCSSTGLWEDHPGTSFAAPLLARECALGLQILEAYCQQEARPFGVTVKAFLSLVASKPDVPDRVKPLYDRTLGRGPTRSDRLSNPHASSAVMLWQGVIDGPTDQVRIQLPIPHDWWREARSPMLRLIVTWDTPVNEAVRQMWACRKVASRLRPHPEARALRGRGDGHASYPVVDRLYDLRRLPEGTEVDGDSWLLELAYDEIADYHPAIDFTPHLRVAFAAELFDEDEDPVSPQAALQALPIAATMHRLSIPPTVVRSPIVLKPRV